MRVLTNRLICSCLWICCAALPAHAATTWTVTGTAEPATIGSASCPGNICPTLRDAVNSAASGDTIVFASVLDGQTITLTLSSNDPGCLTSSPTACNGTGTLSTEFGPSAFFITGGKTLTIDATQNGLTRGIVLSAANNGCNSGTAAGAATCFRLFDVDSGSTLKLAGLTLSHGVALGRASLYGGGALGAGGAIFNQGSLTLTRCSMVGNSALGGSTPNPGSSSGYGTGGGGAGADADLTENGGGPNGGAVNLSSTGYFGGFGGGGGSSNSSSSRGGDGGFGGGGGFTYSSSNYGGSGGFGGGGGASASSGYPSPGGFGGGTSSPGGQIGGAGAGMGGAIFNDAGTVSLLNSTLSTNTAQGGSGFDSGNADGYGGAIFNYMGSVTLNFVTLDGNSVVSGNGYPGPPYTTPGNADGGAIYSLGDNVGLCQSGGNVCNTTSAILTMSNTIAANSKGSTNDVVVNAINGGTSNSTGSGNLVMTESGFSGTLVSTADPQLNALIGGGGIWNVMAPKAGSPAINAVACGGVVLDQRGVSRPQNTQCTIGSVEYDGDVILVDGFEN